jgi:hypothetical protein
MSQQPTLEVVLFRAKAGISDEQVLKASSEIQRWLEGAAGYLKREVSKNEEGQWVDIVHWRTLAEAQQAAQQLMADPSAADLMSFIDPESVSMLHLARQQQFGG